MPLTFDTFASIVLLLTLLAGAGAAVACVRWRSTGGPWVWLCLAVVTLAAAGLRFGWVPAHHAMYVDEPWYLEAARRLLERGALLLCHRTSETIVCDPYTKAAGWPVLLAGAFALFGAGSGVALVVSTGLSTVAIPLTAAVTRLSGGTWPHALLAALIVALHPLHVAWSATAETNSPSTTILLTGITGVLLLIRERSNAYTLLAAGGLGFAAAMRPEMAMALPPALIVLAGARARGRDLLFMLLGGALGATSVAASWGLYLSNSGGTFLSPEHLLPNFRRLLAAQEGGALTLFMLAASAIGCVALLRRHERTVVTLLAGTALLMAAVTVGYDRHIFYPRTVLGSIVLLAPLAALALPPRFIVGAGLLAVALAVPGLRLVHAVSVTQMLETRLVRAIAEHPLPSDAVVIAEWPTVVTAATGRTAMSAHDAINGPGGIAALAHASAARPHYVLCDMFCEGSDAAVGTPTCPQLLAGLALTEEVSVNDDHWRYGLYRIVGLLQAGQPKASCPRVHQ